MCVYRNVLADDSAPVPQPELETDACEQGTDRRGTTDGGGTYELDATLRLAHAELLLSPTLVAMPDATFRIDTRASIGSDDDAIFVTATGADAAGVVAALGDDPTVSDGVLVAEFDDESLFRVTPGNAANRMLPALSGVCAAVRDVRGEDGCWVVDCYLPGRDALSALVADGRNADVSVDVERLADLQRSGSAEAPALSPAQRELLATAREHGYFETPRRISQRELATKFGVSPSAISQRLRTATGELAAYLSC